VIHLERNMVKHSSIRGRNHFLGKKAEEVLVSLANVPDWPPVGTLSEAASHLDWVKWMRRRFPQVFQYCNPLDIIALRKLLRAVWTCSDFRCKEWFVFLLRRYHVGAVKRYELLQEEAGRKKIVSLARNRKAYLDVILADPLPANAAEALCAHESDEEVAQAYKADLPPSNSFEDCAFYLQRNLNRVRICRNKDCDVTPYFFRIKKNQKYCSTKCSLPALLASKRKSWHENKDKWEK
jgi:hypothetical protein